MTPKIFMPMVKGSKKLARFFMKNSNWILATLASVGVLAATGSAVHATIKAVKLCEEKQITDKGEILKTVWKLYIPSVGFVILTISSVLGNAHINARRIARITGMYMASRADTKALKDKAKELLGERKAKKIEEEVQKDKVKSMTPPSEANIVKTGHGDQLFVDGWTGQWFRANPEWIELKFKELNDEISSNVDGIVYVHRYLNMFGLKECNSGNAYWDMYDMLEHGYRKIEPDITTIEWMDVNGKQEMVSTLQFTPWPGGI